MTGSSAADRDLNGFRRAPLVPATVAAAGDPPISRSDALMAVPILKQGPFLIASIQSALTDTDVLQLRDDVMAQVTRHRSRGIIVDVTSLDVMDSFVSRSLRGIAMMTRLRGAETVIVGIQPEVAFAMVQLGMSFEDVQTALDLEEGLALLEAGFGGS
jgi:rsbT antagonist protein RsbS